MAVIVSRQIEAFVPGKPASDYAVGESVFMKVNGVSKEFIVVHQGLPSTVYDSSCDGTWLLMKDIYESRIWDATNNDYENSDIHSYLNNTFVNLFDANIKSAIKSVKLPYTKGPGSNDTLMTGSNGITTKAFLLSYIEVGLGTWAYANTEGDALDYFDGAANSKRISYYNGTATTWWLRSPNNTADPIAWGVNSDGSRIGNGIVYSSSFGVRPAIILPYDTKFDPETNEVVA